jgi:hypothetical protein
MNGFVAGLDKDARQTQRQLRINEKAHSQAALTTRWSADSAAYSSAALMSSSSRYG